MRHIHTFESFLNESSDLNEWRKPKVEDLVHDMKVKIASGRFAGSIGVIHDFQLTDSGNLVDDQVDILVDKPGKPFAYLGLDDILIESINEANKYIVFIPFVRGTDNIDIDNQLFGVYTEQELDRIRPGRKLGHGEYTTSGTYKSSGDAEKAAELIKAGKNTKSKEWKEYAAWDDEKTK